MNVFSLLQELRLQRETPLCWPLPPGLHRLSALVRLRPLRRSGGAGPHRTLLRPLPLLAHPLPTGQSDSGLVRLGGGAQSHQAADRKRRWSQTGVPELSGDLSYWASSALCRRQSAQLPGLQVRPLAQPHRHTHCYCCWFPCDAPVCVRARARAFVCHSSASADIPVFYVNHPTDGILILGCPKARPNMAVAWDRGSSPIYRSEHTAGSTEAPHPRLQIDSGHHLIFNPAKMEDSGRSQTAGPISMWQWNHQYNAPALPQPASRGQ